MRTGCIVNKKGGVSKTTNTIHLGARLAALKQRTLLIDLDPQCDLTNGMGIYENQYSVSDFFSSKNDFLPIQKSDNLFILPGDPNIIPSTLGPNILKKSLSKISSHFDFVLIDTPPASINDLEISCSEIALTASDFFIITMTASQYSIKNADSFLDSVKKKIIKKNKNLDFLGFLFSNVLVTKKSSSYWRNVMEEAAGSLLFKSFIRTDADVEEAVSQGKTIFQHRPQCRAALDYMSFTREFLKKIQHG